LKDDFAVRPFAFVDRPSGRGYQQNYQDCSMLYHYFLLETDNFVHSPNCHFSYVATNPACLQIQARTSRITSDVNAESRIY
jgi:hypothetical protein